MKIAIMQPYIFPYLGYFQLISSVDKFVLYDDVNFIKKGWINRNRIMSNGSEYMFSVPLKKVSQNKTIRDTEISEQKEWGGKFLKVLKMTYAKSPFFKQGFDIIEETVLTESNSIAELAANSIKNVCEYLELKVCFVFSSDSYDNQLLSGKDRILDICKRECAQEYINLPGGKNLYDESSFTSLGIELSFIDVKLPQYDQNSSLFLPGLSIIDLMMNVHKDEINKMLKL